MSAILSSVRFFKVLLCGPMHHFTVARYSATRRLCKCDRLSFITHEQSACFPSVAPVLRGFSSETIPLEIPPQFGNNSGWSRSGSTDQVYYNNNSSRQQKVDRALQKLDVEVRKTGRINLRDVQEIFNEIKTSGVISPTHSLLIIRCCGSLLPEELPVNRTALVSRIWDTLQTLDAKLDVSHYNALLKVYLENDHKFSPTEFLGEMERKAVEPNRVTYQRLIAYYCQQGDIAGASKILDFMKEKDLPINENVFNSLIIGHSRSNDMESAKSIFDLMRNAKLEPSADTYTVFMCGYAEKGDMDAVQNTMKEAEQNDIYLTDRDYMEILFALAANNHGQHVDEVLIKMRKMVGYNQDAINTILKLINIGQEDVAYKLLLTMPRTVLSGSEAAPVGQFFIRHLVRVGRPLEKILHICDDLKKRSLNTTAIVKATESALFFENTGYAEAFLRTMKEQALPVRPHYFWPLLATNRKRACEQGAYDVLKLMIDLDTSANFDTFAEYFFPAISLQDPKSVVETLKGFGYTVNSIISPLVSWLVMDKRLTDAVALINLFPVRLSAVSMIKPLASAYHATGDLDSTLQILVKINESRDSSQRTDWVGNFLLGYHRLAPGQSLELLLSGIKNNDLRISQSCGDLLQNRIGTSEQTENIASLMDDITTASFVSGSEESEGDMTLPHPRDMTLDELENHYIELKAKQLNTRGILRRLLFQYCRYKNLEKAMEIKTELDASMFIYTPAMYAQLMELHVAHNLLDKALEFRQKMREADATFPVDDHKIINLAHLLVKHDKLEDAIKLLTDHHACHGVKESQQSLSGNVWRLLNAPAVKRDVEGVQKLFDTVVNCGFTVPTNMVLGPLVKCHLNRDDVNAALEQFEQCCKKYHCTPMKNEIFVKLIQMEDAERLQKVVDLSTEIHGEMNTMYDLAFAFLDCNQVRQARKIFETPGIRARHQRLDSACEKYVAESKLTCLENLVLLTRDMFGIDRDRMYYYLLRAYAKVVDVNKALGVWTSMQEENVQPSRQTLLFLADFLKRQNTPVPFALPHPSSSQTLPDKLESNDIILQHFNNAVKMEDVDKALDLKKQLEADRKMIPVTTTSYLIELLVKHGRINEAVNITKELLLRKTLPFQRVFRSLLQTLSNAGDLDAIVGLGEHLAESVKKSFRFNSHLARAFLVSGKHEELMDAMEKDLSNNESFPSGVGFLGVLEARPDFLDRVERLASEYARRELYLPMNMIWMHHFIQGDFLKADAIFKATPKLQEHLLFMNVLKKAKSSGNENMLRRLVDTVKHTLLSAKSKGLAYSGLIEFYNTNVEAAEGAFNEAVGIGLTAADLREAALWQLKEQLERSGRTVPFELPTKKEYSSSSSSDSESSDEEADHNK